jgi:hypothetical protein
VECGCAAGIYIAHNHFIDLATNRLTGSVIHHTDANLVTTTGTWTSQTVNGMWGLFRFHFLVGVSAVPSEATYALPVPEDGIYQISLLYPAAADRASNVPVTIHHADGKANLSWNMRKGSKHGFAATIGSYRFEKNGKNTVTLSTTGTNGKVIADGVGFVKVSDGKPAP